MRTYLFPLREDRAKWTLQPDKSTRRQRPYRSNWGVHARTADLEKLPDYSMQPICNQLAIRYPERRRTRALSISASSASPRTNSTVRRMGRAAKKDGSLTSGCI